MFSFLWEDKPHKISKRQITNDYNNGGLRMIDFENFIISQKLVWIKRLFMCNSAPWAKMVSDSIKIDKLYTMGPLWTKHISLSTSNPFWKEVFETWSRFLSQFHICESNLLNIPLWYNSLISPELLFYPHWNRMGVKTPLDLIKSDGSIMSMQEIIHLYGLKTNFLEYLRVAKCLKVFIKKYKIKNFNCIRPVFPPYLHAIINNKKGSKYFYEKLNVQYINQKLPQKWSQELNIVLSDDEWKTIYKICFKSIKRNDFVWFQYRLLHRILGTKSYLLKINKTNSASCSFCETLNETLIHLFVSCPFVNEFWTQLKQGLQQNVGLYIDFAPSTILLGSLSSEHDFFPKNIIILVAKKFIWMCSRTSKLLTIQNFQNYFKNVYLEQEYIANMNCQVDKFVHSWSILKELYEGYVHD